MLKFIYFLLASLFLRGTAAALDTTDVVYCEAPVTGSSTVEFCGFTYTVTHFPNTAGYMVAVDGVFITTLIWTKSHISIKSSTVYKSTHIRPVNLIGCSDGDARVAVCGSTLAWRTVTTVSYTLYAPTGDIATMTLDPDTVTLRITATVTLSVTSTATVTDKVTSVTTTSISGPTTIKTVTVNQSAEPIINTETETETETVTEKDTDVVISTVLEQVTLVTTVFVGGENTSCPAAITITESVTYDIGTGGQLTVFTSGPTAGTSTYTSCN